MDNDLIYMTFEQYAEFQMDIASGTLISEEQELLTEEVHKNGKAWLSKVNKLNGVYSWSLPPLKCCPGAVKPGGNIKNKEDLVPVCRNCYARGRQEGRQRSVHEHNIKAWKDRNWVEDMIEAIYATATFRRAKFRWFDSGDLYDVKLGEKIYQIVKRTPEIEHWMPTRVHKLPKFSGILNKLDSLKNMNVMKSGDSIEGEINLGYEDTTVVTKGMPAAPGTKLCEPEIDKNGKDICGDCSHCYKKGAKVTFQGTGAGMSSKARALARRRERELGIPVEVEDSKKKRKKK